MFFLGNKIIFGGGNLLLEFLFGDFNGFFCWWLFVCCEFNGIYFFFRFLYCLFGLDVGLNLIFCNNIFLEDDISLVLRFEVSLFVMSEFFEKFVMEGIIWMVMEFILYVGGWC